MISISLCMIVKNEEDTLARCLESIKGIADEIVIVDTGSTDKTKEIAAQFTDNIYDFKWVDHFSAARNYAFSKATCQYWMWLDADDILQDDDREKLIHLKETSVGDFDVAMLKYHVAFDESGTPTFTYFRERIIRRMGSNPWEGAVHEAITPSGRVIHEDIAVTHKKNRPSDSLRNLSIYENLLKSGHSFSPRETYYYARELYYHKHYERAGNAFGRFLNMPNGWLENKIEACQMLAYCYYARNSPQEALLALLRSFTFDSPRAEICCDMGKHFLDRKNYEKAIFWYQIALQLPINPISEGFSSPDCHDYIPAIQLSLCSYNLNRLGDAILYNDLAGKAKPSNASYLSNKAFYEKQLKATQG